MLCLTAAATTAAQTPRGADQSRAPDRGAMETARESWQRVPDIFAAMRVTEGSVVADVGAGSGFFTTRLSRAVGARGRVFAVDISASTIAGLRQRLDRDGVTNVDTLVGAADDPKLPTGVLDAALIVNAYHEMREHQAMLAAIRRALKPSGRLVIVEPVMPDARGWPRAAQEVRHQIAPLYVQQDALAAGFVIADVDDPFTVRGGHITEYLLALAPAPELVAAPTGPDPAHAANANARKPDEVVAALNLSPGHVVIDLGAGSGLFTRRFAEAVGPTGRAIGLDIDPSAVEVIKADAAASGLTNYEARLVSAADPAIPRGSADVIFLSNTYHHIEDRVAYFTRVRDALKPNGRLVIVDFPPGPSGEGVSGHPDQKQVESELAAAGYRLVKTHTFLDPQFFLEFVRAR
jgi:ubiquinone/menaquinone biosynthesis C-methylase UbiE